MRRKCPVCRTMPVSRADVKTCSVECSREWNLWSRDMKAKALSGDEEAFEALDDRNRREVSEEELNKWLGLNKQGS